MTSETHLVLHGVAVKKHGTSAAIADLIGRDAAAVEVVLGQAIAGGRVSLVNGKYLLAPAGRMIVEAQYSKYYAQVRADPAFIAAHERFEPVNSELKQVITDWQTMTVGGSRVANDHSNAAYDDKVIARLGAVHEKLKLILERLAQAVPRFGHYAHKLGAALIRAEDGDRAWVSDATLDSYHTVWFELHEDILRVLGRERVE